MKNKFVGEIIICILLIALLILFFNPIKLMMPNSMHPLMIPLLVILFILFTGVVWKEKPGDEREHLHKFIASRYAYFAGITTIIIGIIIESVHKMIDPWLILAVCIMLLAKLIGLIYGYYRH